MLPFRPDVCVILYYFLRQCIITLQKCPNNCRSTKHYQETIPKSTHWIQSPRTLTWNAKLDGLDRCFCLLPFGAFCSLQNVRSSGVFFHHLQGLKRWCNFIHLFWTCPNPYTSKEVKSILATSWCTSGCALVSILPGWDYPSCQMFGKNWIFPTPEK